MAERLVCPDYKIRGHAEYELWVDGENWYLAHGHQVLDPQADFAPPLTAAETDEIARYVEDRRMPDS